MIFYLKLNLYIKLILILSFFILLLCAIINLCWTFLKDYKPSTELFQFKIKNFYVTIFWASFYILCVIFFLYFWRIAHFNVTVDLKQTFKILKDLFSLFKDLFFHDHLVCVLYVSILFCILLFTLLVLFLFHKTTMHHLFLLHFYIDCQSCSIFCDRIPRKWRFYHLFLDKFCGLYPYDIIVYIISETLYNVMDALETFNYPNKYVKLVEKIRSNFLRVTGYSKIYEMLFNLAPYIIFIYDCLFNNWVLSTFFIFMIFYVPIRLIKKISHKLIHIEPYICDLINEIYYHKVSDLYCMPEDFLGMVQNYLKIGLETNIKNIPIPYNETDITMTILLNSHFDKEYDSNKVYNNGAGIRLLRTSETELYRIAEELDNYEYELGERWFILHENFKDKPNK